MLLNVLSIEEANRLLAQRFCTSAQTEHTPLQSALFRVLAEDITAAENVPHFTRSTVDGYAVRAKDTFGCSMHTPALLQKTFDVEMGALPKQTLGDDVCAYVPTGAAIPSGADAMVMLEDTEKLPGELIAVEKAAAPGQNIVFCGDDVQEGACVLKKGTLLRPKDIGTLAALGVTTVPVARKMRVGILSTGDELVEAEKTPKQGEIRDVNGPLLAAAVTAAGGEPVLYGICSDDRQILKQTLSNMCRECELLLLSGGSSAGEKDAAAAVIEELGTVLFHGLAAKPGKPTIGGEIRGVPVFGLPGHPMAAYFIFWLLVRKLIARYNGTEQKDRTVETKLLFDISSNHGREEYVPVILTAEGAMPIRAKSGLITKLANTSGYLCIQRDTEGLDKGERVTVHLWETL